MARLIRCPRCQGSIDATNVAGGSTVRCPDCGAMVRVPTGQTGVHPRVPTPAPQPAVAAQSSGSGTKVRERQTALFRKMSGVKAPGDRRPSRVIGGGAERGTRYVRPKSNAGIWIGVGVGAAGLVLALVVVMANKEEPKKRPVAKGQPVEDVDYEPAMAATGVAGVPVPPKPKGLHKNESGQYVPPATFETGARKHAQNRAGFSEMTIDAAARSEFEKLAAAGKSGDLLNEDWRWIACAFDGVLSDNEAVAKASVRLIHDFCAKRGITTEKGGNPVRLDLSNSAEYRASMYHEWGVDWWGKTRNQQAVIGYAPPGAVVPGITAGAGGGGNTPAPRSPEEAARDAGRENWDKLMMDLRAGGAFDDTSRPEGNAFARVKGMGEAAYPFLVKYIDHEDVMLGRAAVTVLNTLTGLQKTLPTEGTKAQAKTEWETWVNSRKNK